MSDAGYEGVALISVDDTWSAMRFRRMELVGGTETRRERMANRADRPAGASAKDRVLDIPQDLQQALDDNPQAKQFFDGLSYTHRKEYVRWVTDAKREETRTGRIQKSVEKLVAGVKSPFLKA
ncbi:YdeI/OmpD-associated family protein [Paenibacillus piri]|uniref:Bacteriocin-protection protein n=1 Tax=Paenibacillus piri TaxID=2547395 RepID=A0A4R5KQS6_9BACL|nr:YdeI/OmpD-associated family protein [Paenibacillus piri]TDF98123.1 hypothetical protein E1757_11505 [Paenibacillus piri]